MIGIETLMAHTEHTVSQRQHYHSGRTVFEGACSYPQLLHEWRRLSSSSNLLQPLVFSDRTVNQLNCLQSRDHHDPPQRRPDCA